LALFLDPLDEEHPTESKATTTSAVGTRVRISQTLPHGNRALADP
jgi:hypothetical protein